MTSSRDEAITSATDSFARAAVYGYWRHVDVERSFTVAMLLVVLGPSWLTWRFIELPGQRWSRARFDPRVRHVFKTATAGGAH